jgi:Tfp pilus assembly protein PilO
VERPLWQKILVTALIALTVIWASYNFILKNRIKQLSSAKDLLSSIEKEINLIIPKDIIPGKDGNENKLIEKKLEETGKKLPSETSIPYLMQDFIAGSSRDLKINYDLVQPSSLVSEQKYKRLPISIELSCDFNNLNLYLMRLESLPMMVRIDQLDISKDNNSKMLDARLMVSAFVIPDTRAGSVREKVVMPSIPKSDPFFSHKTISGATGEVSAQKPRVKKRTKTSLLQFKGVFGDKEPLVFLNDQVVGIGGVVNGFKVIGIRENSVVVKRSGKTYTLRLGGEI